nr:7493_t:CDS:2 [Entrophospora candida]
MDMLTTDSISDDQGLDNEANINGDIKNITNEKQLELELYSCLVGKQIQDTNNVRRTKSDELEILHILGHPSLLNLNSVSLL